MIKAWNERTVREDYIQLRKWTAPARIAWTVLLLVLVVVLVVILPDPDVNAALKYVVGASVVAILLAGFMKPYYYDQDEMYDE
jgi:amino acid transporter